MRQVNVHEAKSQLSRLLEEVERGEEVTIARNGVPVAKLTRVTAAPRSGFGSSPEFAAWSPERLESVDRELERALTEESSSEHAALVAGLEPPAA